MLVDDVVVFDNVLVDIVDDVAVFDNVLVDIVDDVAVFDNVLVDIVDDVAVFDNVLVDIVDDVDDDVVVVVAPGAGAVVQVWHQGPAHSWSHNGVSGVPAD